MFCKFSGVRRSVLWLVALSLQVSWAADDGPIPVTGPALNNLRNQFNAARKGDALKVESLVGEWICDFTFEDRDLSPNGEAVPRSESYTLVLKDKLNKDQVEGEGQSDEGLSIEAEVIRHVDRAHHRVEIRMGQRTVVSGQASWPFVHEMAHDMYLDTVDEIAVDFNGAIKTLLVERSYFYKSATNEAKKRVPRAYSVCSRSI